MGLLTKDQILSVNDLPFKDVDVPEWGGTVRVRTMTGAERDAYELSLVEFRAGEAVPRRDNMRAKLLARCIVDEKGSVMFSEKEIVELGRKSTRAISRLFDVAVELSAVSKAEVQAAEKK